MEDHNVLFRDVSSEVARAELKLRLPEIVRAVQHLEENQNISRETMRIEFVV